MLCNSCRDKSDKNQPMPQKRILPIPGVVQCEHCSAAINRAGFAVLPVGSYPMMRKETALRRRFGRNYLDRL